MRLRSGFGHVPASHFLSKSARVVVLGRPIVQAYRAAWCSPETTSLEIIRFIFAPPPLSHDDACTLKWKVAYLAARLFVKMGAKQALLMEISEWSKLTPLMFAARSGNAAVMKVLVEEGGADTQLRNARGHSALDLLVGGENALEETRVLLEGAVKKKGE